MKLAMGFRAVTYYGYRSAIVSGIIVTLNRNCGDGRAFEKEALDNYNRHNSVQLGYIDNHSVMQFYNCTTEATIYISFSDESITIGTGIVHR